MKQAKHIYCLMIPLLLIISCKIQKAQNYNSADDKSEISRVLTDQERAWNQGDIERFMEGYWNDEKLTFIGKNGISYGWDTTLNNYKKGYPNRNAMGKLHFEVFELNPIASDVYYMLGQYTLTRADDQPTGFFTLVWKKINNEWLIISDHTSG